ncbi:MAG TPA: MarR family transcriptional regulator [Kouleothrix sp.]|mgnify:CR=1 FL=1|uniref:MarR family winged helix-turn-helix transcriptional regulator n=1 Tax=Kouleothrix sp. TaxID=2779161 RepID=UPI002D136033|nr:MarR family transcriptional regulator [Kouleothrix sp.]HRC77545.1 MarR family transcriptional regulator [Kouleothrix sp.]
MQNILDNSALAAWRNFITAHAALIERIDGDLVAAECVPLSWYDVLIELQEAPERRLRMSDLASRVVLSRSTLTHLVERLEDQGLVRRERSAHDRRGAYAVLTDQGHAALRRAWPIYAQGIADHFSRHLSAGEVATMTAALERILGALRGTP